ncbi:MAG: exosortase A [Vicinamibacterales bacterium]
MSNDKAIGLGAIFVSFLVLFYPVFAGLVSNWQNDDNYSHGFLIVPIALYFAWERREKLVGLPFRGSWLGLVVIVGSLGVLIAGRLGAELFLSRIPIIGVLAGCILFLAGWTHLRVLAFPLLFLLLMIPIPAIIFNQIAFPLQLLASRFGEFALQAADIPVLREGNVITLANTQLEVAEACSGIRSLISLLTLGILFGYFTHPGTLVRWIMALTTIPVAIVANGFRVAGTGIAAHYYGPEAAEGFFHTFSGWLVFVVALVILVALHRAIIFFAPVPQQADAAVA